jgi:uncharacterized protein
MMDAPESTPRDGQEDAKGGWIATGCTIGVVLAVVAGLAILVGSLVKVARQGVPGGAAGAPTSGVGSAARTMPEPRDAHVGQRSSQTTADPATLARQCDDGSIPACCELAERYGRGIGVPQDRQRSAELFRKVGEAGGASQCPALLELLAGAQGLAEEACQKGDQSACAALSRARSPRPSAPPAPAALQTQCDAGTAAACTTLGRLYADAEGVPMDPRKAMTLFQKACDAGDAKGCLNLGMGHVSGAGGVRDRAKGRAALARACAMGEQLACLLAARARE